MVTEILHRRAGLFKMGRTGIRHVGRTDIMIMPCFLPVTSDYRTVDPWHWRHCSSGVCPFFSGDTAPGEWHFTHWISKPAPR